MQTHQEMFDTVLFALRKQGVRSYEGDRCMYRGPNGTKCAAGHLIPDEMYDPGMDSPDIAPMSVHRLTFKYPALGQLWGEIAGLGERKAWQTATAQLLRDMQTVHDDSMPTTQRGTMFAWEFRMEHIARNYNLTYTPKNS